MNSKQILKQFKEEAPDSPYITKVFEAFLQKSSKIYSDFSDTYGKD